MNTKTTNVVLSLSSMLLHNPSENYLNPANTKDIDLEQLSVHPDSFEKTEEPLTQLNVKYDYCFSGSTNAGFHKGFHNAVYYYSPQA